MFHIQMKYKIAVNSVICNVSSVTQFLPMSKWGYEVKTAMNSVINNVSSV